MHQYNRSSSRSTSGATSPRPNPTRTNNQRNQAEKDVSEPMAYTERPVGDVSATTSNNASDRAAKNAEQIRQVTQNFFKRAALMIVSSRVNLTPEMIPNTNQVRSTKWFQIVFDESEEFTDEVADWTMVDVLTERPQPLIIEIYLDTSELKRNQTLVLIDERKNKWDVREALGASSSAASTSRRVKSAKVILERWKIYLGDPPGNSSSGSNEPMPNVYKKAIMLFRSLYTYCRFLPAWKFRRMLGNQPASLATLRPMYRILDEVPMSGPRDPLTTPLYPTADKTTQSYDFLPVRSPVGTYNIHVTYRVNCDFHVDDSDTILSSHFMGMDDHHFQSSLGEASDKGGLYSSGANEIGSLPIDRRSGRDRANLTQAYGSLSTFHNAGHATGTSPLSALRAAREMASDDQEESPPQRPESSHRTSQDSKSRLRAEGANPVPRRISVSFQPFKQGSLSSSPAAGIMTPASPEPSTTVRSSEASKELPVRNRPSISGAPQITTKASAITATPEVSVESPDSASPKAPPAISRYSSSFGHRRSRFSSGGTSSSKADEDNNSSGKASQTSSNQPGSGLLADGESGSPGSIQADDENISDFINLLEQKKDLKSFNRTDDASRDASTRRTTAALSKFRGMRDSNAALGDSLSSSMLLQRSSSSSSRQLPTLAGASVSTSSSPGKAISPHTPYTPSVPSRLSEHSTIRGDESRSSAQGRPHQSSSPDDSSDSTTRNPITSAIPIPQSPQRYPYIRRSSSAHPRHRTGIEGLEEFDRPASLSGLGSRTELSMSELLHSQQGGEQSTPAEDSGAQDEGGSGVGHGSMESQDVESTQQSSAPTGTPRAFLRERLSRRGSRGSGGHADRGSRRPPLTVADDEEPFIFAISELNRQSMEDENPGFSSTTPRGTTGMTSDSSASASKDTSEKPGSSYGRATKKNSSNTGGNGSGSSKWS